MDLKRPFLIIPKLINQPTWGGDYIVNTKRWQDESDLQNVKIGQSYELFDKSNLSLLLSSDDEGFKGEITNSKAVELQTKPANTLALSQLISENPEAMLGKSNVQQYGPWMHLLIKFTQALGNSFQLHIKDGVKDSTWKSKPESWYYFEPGLITLGVKAGVDWSQYEKNSQELQQNIVALSQEVRTGTSSFEKAKHAIAQLIADYNLWQYVNTVETKADDLIDLSACGIHHSWEENAQKAPLGNIVYELQLNVMDNIATIRNFDKGKMHKDGSTRTLHIEDYFKHIDRSPKVNNPQTHLQKSQIISNNAHFTYQRLLQTKYYTLDNVEFHKQGAEFTESVDAFRHIFVKNGKVEVTCGTTTIRLSRGHSVFIPATATEYTIRNSQSHSIVLNSY